MQGRVRILKVFFVVVLLIMAARALDLQVIASDDIIRRSHRSFERTVELSPSRGNIYDVNGECLARSLEVKSIAVNPRVIENPSRAAEAIAGILNIPSAQVRRKLSRNKYFVWLKRQAAPEESMALKRLGIKGIGFYDEVKRFYPESEFLANIIGFVGVDGKGLEGIELAQEDRLRGISRHVQAQRDGGGRSIYARGLSLDEEKNGADITLTIDRRIQYIAYSELKRSVKANNARSGFVIITDPSSGAIRAMASYPSFDSNKGVYRHLHGHRNRGVVDVFEPGSIVKPLWIAGGMEKGIFNLRQSVFCENGSFTLHRKTFHDHEEYGWLPIRDIIKHSSNIGMVKLMEGVAAQDMFSTMQAFGLTRPTGMGFPGEARGLVRSPDEWRRIDKASLAFGQGFNVTGIQFISAFNAMVNGGFLLQPRIIKGVRDNKGSHETSRVIRRRVLSQETSSKITSILQSVVSIGGTARNADIQGYQIFGKTGTSQKVDPLTGAYSKSAFISTFVGGVKDANSDTAFTMIVSINEPHPEYYASTVACPLFRRIALKTIGIMDTRPVMTVAQGGQG
ncbi:MAG: penicillin-binding protein 2 [Thermodesulfobacteriota bacterium]|nr:penicillin-binding protein 2 [Thermodesulfobacteriota bacterium]